MHWCAVQFEAQNDVTARKTIQSLTDQVSDHSWGENNWESQTPKSCRTRQHPKMSAQRMCRATHTSRWYLQPFAEWRCCSNVLQGHDHCPDAQEVFSDLPQWLSSCHIHSYYHEVLWESCHKAYQEPAATISTPYAVCISFKSLSSPLPSTINNKNTYVRLLLIDPIEFSIQHYHTLAADWEAEPVGPEHFNWILDFLTGRPQSIWSRNSTSSTAILNTGAPQGCMLSPLLFTLLTHD